MKNKRSLLSAFILFSFVFSFLFAVQTPVKACAAEAEPVYCTLTIYTQKELTSLEVQVGQGFIPDTLGIEPDEIIKTEALKNNIKKYTVKWELVTDKFPLGKSQAFTLVVPGSGLFSRPEVISNTVSAAPKKASDGKNTLNLTLKENINKQYSVNVVNEEGKSVSGKLSDLKILLRQKDTDAKPYKVKGSPGKNYITIPLDYDDNGEFISSGLTIEATNIGKSFTILNNGEQDSYTVKDISLKDDIITLVAKKVPVTSKKFTVIINKPFEILGREADFTFEAKGSINKSYTQHINLSGESGQQTFEIQMNGISEDSKLALKALPDEFPYYSIADQSYDTTTNTLNVTLGKKIYLCISPIETANFNDFALHHAKEGFSFGLYSPQTGKLLEKSQSSTNTFGAPVNLFTKVTPGEYDIRIIDALEKYKNSYDITHTYKLKLSKDGQAQIKVVQSNSNGEEVWANPGGGIDSRFDGSANSKALTGYKHPFFIFLSPKAKFEKYILDPKTQKEVKQVEAKVGDNLTFRLRTKIPADYKIITKFDKYFDMGVAQSLNLEDKLDQRFELVAHSIKVLKNEKPTSEYEAQYDQAAHTIKLLDKAPFKVSNFDFNKNIELRDNEKLSIEFQVKVKSIGKKPLYNNIPGDTVEITPLTSIEFNKQWIGGASEIKSLDIDKLLDNFKLLTWQGNKKLAEEPVKKIIDKDSLKIEENKNFSFKISNLKLYSDEDLKKPADERQPYRYEIIEKLPEELAKKFSVSCQSEIDDNYIQHITMSNMYKNSLVDLQLTKVWKLDSSKNAEDYTPQFELTVKNEVANVERHFIFNKDTSKLIDEHNEELKFELSEIKDRQINKKIIQPTLMVKNNVYIIKNLPTSNEDGNAFTYSIKEVDVVNNGKSVKDIFEVIGNDTSLKVNKKGILSKTITNKTSPPTPPNTPPNTPPTPPTTPPNTPPGTPPPPQEPPVETYIEKKVSYIPKTSDIAYITPYICIAGVGLLLLAVLVYARRTELIAEKSDSR